MKPTETLSKFLVETKFEDLPAEVVKKAKNSLKDTWGCGILEE